VPTWR